MDHSTRSWRQPGAWLALGVIIMAYFLQDPVERATWSPLQRLAELTFSTNGQMSLANYAGLMVFRLIWNALLVAAVLALLGRPYDGFPVRDRAGVRHFAIGLLTGLVVMVFAILSIAG